MSREEQQDRANVILGQKYAYATIALLLGIASFVNVLGLEKSYSGNHLWKIGPEV